MLERDIHNPTLWTLERLAMSFGIEIEELVKQARTDSQNRY